MPGSGVRQHNIQMLKEATGAVEFHTAPRLPQKTKMQFINYQINDSNESVVIDGESIKEMRSILNNLKE